MEQKISRFIKLYPWYSGFTGDLLFYIAIDTLFLTIVKNFSAAQIVSITSLSQFACIALQFPILFVIKRIGNTDSARVGALCLLISSVLITFGKSYYLVLLGRIFHDVAAVFRSASFVTLENNLDLVNKHGEFVRIRTSANTVYAVVTMIISFVASWMFTLNNYLPMIGCISTCAIGFILSFFMKDYSDYNKIERKKKNKEKAKVTVNKFIVLAVVVYSIFYPIVNMGQSEGKLFIQQNILLDFDIDDTAFILGIMICVSRIVRVASNVLFVRLYRKYKQKVGVALPILLCASIGCMLFGSFIPFVMVKITIMAIGYIIILFARDPYRLYMQDVIFDNTPREQHQTLITVLELGVKLGTVGMGLSFSAILLKYPMLAVVAIMFAVALIEIYLSIKLYKMIMVGKELKKSI